MAQEHLQQFISRVELSDPYRLADFAAAITTADGVDLQRVLDTSELEERLHLALELLTKEREIAKLQRDIAKSVEDRMSKQQREYFLKEQLKSIKNVGYFYYPELKYCCSYEWYCCRSWVLRGMTRMN